MKKTNSFLCSTFVFYFANMQAKGELFTFLKENLSIRHILNVSSLIYQFTSQKCFVKMETKLLDI